MTSVAQSCTNSCGAASLVCAAIELGVTKITQNEKTFYLSDEISSIEDHTLDAEMALYEIATGVSPHEAETGNANTWGYCLPSGLIKAATELKLKAVVVSYDENLLSKLLAKEERYNKEFDLLKESGLLVKKSIDEHNKPPEEVRELQVLYASNGDNEFSALHYVLVRPNGSVMDPTDGEEYESIEVCMQRISNENQDWRELGVSLFVSN